MASFSLKGILIVNLISISCIQYSNGFLFGFINRLYKVYHCITYTTYSNSYNDSYPDLVIATFIAFEGNFLLPNFHSLSAVTKELEKMPSIPGININHLIYLYPRNDCKNSTFELFLDLLLNKKLLNGKPFKIVAILTHLNNNE